MASKAEVEEWARNIRDGKEVESSQVEAVSRVTRQAGSYPERIRGIIAGKND